MDKIKEVEYLAKHLWSIFDPEPGFTKWENLIQSEVNFYRIRAKNILDEGYSRTPKKLLPLDFKSIWESFEQFLEPHTCDEIIKPIYARNVCHIKNWVKSLCERYGHPQQELIPLDYELLRPLFDDCYNRKIINHSELMEKCSNFGLPQQRS